MGVSIRIAHAAATIGTPTYTQDFTVPGWSMAAANIKAAMFIVSRATTDGVPTDHAILSVGITDGGRSFAFGASAQHGVDTSVRYRVRSQTRCIWILDLGATSDAHATFNSWIDDGVRINWTDAPSSAWIVTCILFAGTDLSAYVGDWVPATTAIGVETTVTVSPAFPVDQLIVLSGSGTTYGDSTWVTPKHISMGFADRSTPIVQGGIFAIYPTNATASTGSLTVSNLYAARVASTSVQEIIEFTASGFRAKSTLAGVNVRFAYLALGYAGAVSHSVKMVSSPGFVEVPADIVTATTFKPQFVLQMPLSAYLLNTALTAGEGTAAPGCGVFGLAAFNVTESVSHFVSDDNAADPMNTESYTNNALVVRSDTGITLCEASLGSFDDTGYTLNYTTVNLNSGTASSIIRYWPTLIIGAVSSVPVAGPIPAIQYDYRRRRTQ
jgi:hypothetical protein